MEKLVIPSHRMVNWADVRHFLSFHSLTSQVHAGAKKWSDLKNKRRKSHQISRTSEAFDLTGEVSGLRAPLALKPAQWKGSAMGGGGHV